MAILSFYWTDHSWLLGANPLNVSWHKQRSAWKHRNVGPLHGQQTDDALMLEKLLFGTARGSRCIHCPLLMLQSVITAEFCLCGWTGLCVCVWGLKSHSPLKLGRLFSLNAAKPSSRSLVGITFKKETIYYRLWLSIVFEFALKWCWTMGKGSEAKKLVRAANNNSLPVHPHHQCSRRRLVLQYAE